MKKTFTRILALTLALVSILSMAACKKEEENKTPATDVSKYTANGTFDPIANPLSWDNIEKFPILAGKEGLTVEEARQHCVDFFRYTKTAAWIPSEDYDYIWDKNGANNVSLTGGVIHGGLPYVSMGTGSVYRLMHYMDTEKGVVDIEKFTAKEILLGNQCSYGAYWGWGRVINSPTYGLTTKMTHSNGFLRLGNYTYDDNMTAFNNSYTTTTVCEENGTDVMYEAYALFQPADGLLQYLPGGGHVVMVATEAVVVRNADGSINPEESYITVIDQTASWTDSTTDEGDKIHHQKNVDAKWTFKYLYDKSYIPFTFKEWLGEDGFEKAEAKYSVTGDSLSMDQIYSTRVEANYGISDVYAQVYDANGVEVLKIITHADQIDMRTLKFANNPTYTNVWGNPDELKADGNYTVTVTAQLSTGERPVVFEGKFTP